MEILTRSALFYSDPSHGAQPAVDIAQIIAASQRQPPAAGQDYAAETLRKKKKPDVEGAAGPNGGNNRPLEETVARRDGRPADRQMRLQGRQDRNGLREILVPEGKMEKLRSGTTVVRNVISADNHGEVAGPDKIIGPDKAAGPDKIAATLPEPGIAEAGGEPAEEILPAGVSNSARPAGETLQLKTAEPMAQARQHVPFSPPPELKNHNTDRSGTLTYTFNKANPEFIGVNSVQIAFKGSTVLTPSNRATYDNLLAHQNEGGNYRILPDSEQRQRRQQRDYQPEDEQ